MKGVLSHPQEEAMGKSKVGVNDFFRGELVLSATRKVGRGEAELCLCPCCCKQQHGEAGKDRSVSLVP